MVHIKNDIRSKRSAEMISEGMLRCLKTKSFSDLTVAELAAVSGVGRTTFYRLFDNICDVLYYRCDMLNRELTEAFRQQETASGFIQFSMEYWLKNHALLEAVFASNRPDILQEAMLNNSEYLIRAFSLESIPKNKLDYMISTASSVLCSTLIVWRNHGQTETVDEICRHMQDVVAVLSYMLNGEC